MSAKTDLKREYKHLYSASAGRPTLVEVPPLNFLMIDGVGDPDNSAVFQQAIEALYSLSYTMKFREKLSGGEDFVVMPLEGLWWHEDAVAGRLEQVLQEKASWQWTLMIAQPPPIDAGRVEHARAELTKKKDLPALVQVRFEQFEEGLAAQIMHVGPYADELPTIQQLHAYAAEQGCELSGRHHEIYLGDPRRSAPEKLKTILRQPVRRTATQG